MRVSIVTVSDRASADKSLDRSTEAIRSFLFDKYPDSQVIYEKIIPDELHEIQRAVVFCCDEINCDLLLTSGGTGFSDRDITPEAVSPLLEKQAPGLVHLMLQYATTQCTPLAALSRPVAGVRGQSLVITLPGSPKACVENLTGLLPVLRHAVDLLHSSKSTKILGDVRQMHERMITPFLEACQIVMEAKKPHSGCNCARADDEQAKIASRPRQSPFEMVPVPQAMQIILDQCKPMVQTATTNVDRDLIGSIVADDVYAAVEVPAFDASFVDGYAVRAPIDINCELLVTHDPLKLLMSTEGHLQYAVRITTGSIVPNEANAIVMVEDTELVEQAVSDGAEMRIRIVPGAQSPNPGDFVRRRGSDISRGSKLLSSGSLISAFGAELGTLIAAGVDNVCVYRKPCVAVISSGNEIVAANAAELPAGKVRDINSVLLLSCLQQYGYKTVDMGIIPDDPKKLKETLLNAANCAQVVITTGGVSIGERDYMKSVLQEAGAKVHFGRVNVKPGKPTTFASDGNTLFFGLPGNPVSALVMFHVFVLPALRYLSGYPNPNLPVINVELTNDIELDQRPEYHRAILDFQTMTAKSTGSQTSSRTQSLTGANCLLQLPGRTSDRPKLFRGATVTAVVITLPQ